jgi:hypothetical protein
VTNEATGPEKQEGSWYARGNKLPVVKQGLAKRDEKIASGAAGSAFPLGSKFPPFIATRLGPHPQIWRKSTILRESIAWHQVRSSQSARAQVTNFNLEFDASSSGLSRPRRRRTDRRIRSRLKHADWIVCRDRQRRLSIERREDVPFCIKGNGLARESTGWPLLDEVIPFMAHVHEKHANRYTT